MSIADSNHFGTITFSAPEQVELSSPGDPSRTITVARQRGEWRPPDRIADHVFDGFAVPIDCYRGSDGIRRIIPTCSFDELIDLGAVGGLAVLHGIRRIDAQTDHSYRAMHLIHQYVRGRSYRNARGMKEHLTRCFQHSRDLYIRVPSRDMDSERNVLPDGLGRTKAGDGHDWSVAAVTARGRDAASEAGHVNPTSDRAITFGLYEAARRNPLDVAPEEVPRLIRCALFQLDDTDGDLPRKEGGELDDDLIDEVTRRLLVAIQKHLGDTQEAFDRWFLASSNSVIRQVAKQKKAPGGELSHGVVRRIVLELGWRAYGYVGQCVHAMMRTIANALPEPLDETEKRLYEHMHEAQSYYGGHPAAMLAERMGLLRPAVLAIWEEPDNREHVRVLHRMLEYYAHMARSRREADRRGKGRVVVPQPSAIPGDKIAGSNCHVERQDGVDAERVDAGGTSGRHQFHEAVHAIQQGDEEDAFAIAAERIRLVEELECPEGCRDWEYRLEAAERGEQLRIQMRCRCGATDQGVSISYGEFAELAAAELDWRRRDLDPDKGAES